MPREVMALSSKKIGKRSMIYSVKELERFARKYSGTHDPFVSTFSFDGEVGSAVIDKFLYDFDNEHDPYALKFAKWLYDNEIPYIPVGTYFDRYHIYVLIHPQQMTPSELHTAQMSLIEQAGCYIKVKNENGNGEYFQPMTDTHIIGDIRRLVRIPNTARYPKEKGDPIKVYCTYLPIKFFEMPKNDIYTYLKQYNTIPDSPFPLKPLEEIIKPIDKRFRSSVRERNDIEIELEYIPDDPYLQLIQRLLRPCIFKALMGPEPRHFIRLAATIDLRDLAFREIEIYDIYSRIGWLDFEDGSICEYQIGDIFGKRSHYRRYSCKSLRLDYRVVCDENCPYQRNLGRFIPLTELLEEVQKNEKTKRIYKN